MRHRRLFPYLAILAVIVVGVALTEAVQRTVVDRTYQVRRIEALGTIAQLRAQIESEINSVLFLSHGLTSYVASRPDIEPEQWRALSAEILRGSRHIRNIGLAPDNIISFVYPLQGNEGALGLDYEQNERQWPAVKMAIEAGSMILAGPLELVQGGTGLIARTPIYVHGMPAAGGRYWGLASVVIDADSMFASVGLTPVINGYQVAIRGKDGTGVDGEVFFGDPAVFAQPLAEMQVVFPNGSWVIAAQPASASAPVWMSTNLVRIIAYSVLALVVGLLIVLVRLYQNVHGEAMHDPLTGLPNRRLMLERINQLMGLHERTGVCFTLYFIDLNEFKPVNDRLGHLAGDALLKTVGQRLAGAVRGTDTVARTGGDEFMVLQPMVRDAAEASRIVEKIQKSLFQPFSYRQESIDISAAIGFACFPDEALNVDDLVRLADDRMYAAKHAHKQDSREIGEAV
ncbi:diguanylate cyclase domain-containing protein [Marinobacterium sp. YM272]|uniref:diguanylate cyclase domain-containing protein n=1 Tax=Marinobacterium sp. YM272 TaxID=3421654 RepID=UPI003D7F70F6